MATVDLLDVTIIEPRLKHPTIFQKFDALLPGEGFVIHNDHDPKPLYYQLVGERGLVFTWQYLEKGPEYWKVEIRKATKKEEVSIGELVKEDFRKAEVFKKFGIDFCCGGKKTIAKVCEEKGIDRQQLEVALNNIDLQPKGKAQNFDAWNLTFLTDYVINTHHSYVRESIPVILTYAQKVANRHGDTHPEVIEVANHFIAVANELQQHMQKEEVILFPYIKELEKAGITGGQISSRGFGSVQNPIKIMESEHESAGGEMEEIRRLTNGYAAPEDACATFKVLYQKLEEFENDLFEHVHLENNILFPKSIELEKNFQ